MGALGNNPDQRRWHSRGQRKIQKAPYGKWLLSGQQSSPVELHHPEGRLSWDCTVLMAPNRYSPFVVEGGVSCLTRKQ